LNFSVRAHFFRAFLKNRHNKLYFSVSDDFFCVYIVTHRKSYNFSVGFHIFLSGYFETDRIIVIFLCVPKKRTEKFITHRKKRDSSSECKRLLQALKILGRSIGSSHPEGLRARNNHRGARGHRYMAGM